MIKPELKGEPYLQNMQDLDKFIPNDPEIFSVIIEFGIGTPDSEGFDNYTVNVCTPAWLKNDLEKNGKPNFLKGTLLVEEYNPDIIIDRIREVILATSGKDWTHCNLKLVKYFNWEFED